MQQEPTQANPPPKTETAKAPLSSNPEVETKKSPNTIYSPSVALLRLLQTAFNRQTPSLQSAARASSSSSWVKQQPGRSLSPPSTGLPPKMLYQALDMINKFRGPEDNVYSDYTDGFYSNKPYRHRDDRLLQALFEMIDDASKWRKEGKKRDIRLGEGMFMHWWGSRGTRQNEERKHRNRTENLRIKEEKKTRNALILSRLPLIWSLYLCLQSTTIHAFIRYLIQLAIFAAHTYFKTWTPHDTNYTYDN